MNHDAIVIGAGPAGSTAAFLLARAGWNVAIIEKREFPRRKVCGEFISAPALELLARIRLAEDVLEGSGPEIRNVALYAGNRIVANRLSSSHPPFRHARALGREHLDKRLLDAARRAGAEVWQPWRVEKFVRDGDGHVVSLRHAIASADRSRNDSRPSSRGAQAALPEPFDKVRTGCAASVVEGRSNPDAIVLRAPVLIAAHGSWDTGALEVGGTASDYVAFKAHLANCDLPPHTMPLVTFDGGYAGLLTTDEGRVSIAYCVRREALARFRSRAVGASAGAAVLAHVLAATPKLRDVIEPAVREGAWLAVGPLRPGIHGRCHDGAFTIGNAHGEAHPIVGEGITMAMQSAWLLSERLISAGTSATTQTLDAIARAYESAYRQAFAPRIRAASAFAALASRPHAAAALARFMDNCPPLFGFFTHWAGKSAAFPVELDAMQTAVSSR